MTFTAAQQRAFSSALRERITRNETEILEAASEFTAGWEQRTGPSLDLQIAVAAMQSAISQLSLDDAPGAVDSEQEALASLIRARQNIRQKLSQSNSSSSACRTFDRQQEQRLRKPEDLKKDQNQELTACRQNLQDLAQQQRKWSEDVRSGREQQLDRDPSEQKTASSPSPSSSSSATPSSESTASTEKSGSPTSSQPSAEDLARRQRELIDEWKETREKLADLAQSTDATTWQAAEIEQSMQRGLEQQQRGDAQTAAQESDSAADMLQQLADHLATFQSEDTLERFSQAHELAGHLAQRQRELGDQLAGRTEDQVGELAGPQRALSAQAGLLAEQLERLRGEASVSDPRTADALQRIEREHAPREIAQQMSLAARDIAQSNPSALSTVRGAEQRLTLLATDLQGARAALGQPRLEELLALERDVARAIEQLEDLQASRALAASERSSLENRLASLAAADPRMDRALNGEAGDNSSGRTGETPTATDSDNQSTRSVSQPAETEAQAGGEANSIPHGNREVRPGFYSRSRWMTPGRLRQANQVVQRKIQETILAGAQLDGDAPIPPEYAPLVEEYYRQLSDDLR